jgi:predicted transposase/invertase (TIGR01784 family)
MSSCYYIIKKITPDFEVIRKDPATENLIRDENATAFLHEMGSRFEDIKIAFPKARFDGTMYFVCRLENNSYALVEMQVIPHECWDRRALAYLAAFYGNQLLKADKWKVIKKVIGINILGGGKDSKAHWVDTPTQFVRHYKVQEQLHSPAGYIDDIELIQYSFMNAPKMSDDQEKQDWITFLKYGHSMTEELVQQRIKTPEVSEAFKRAKIKSLPAKVLAAYKAEYAQYHRYSDHTEDIAQKSREEGRKEAFEEAMIEISMGLIQKRKLTPDDVMQSDDYSPELKTKLKKLI